MRNRKRQRPPVASGRAPVKPESTTSDDQDTARDRTRREIPRDRVLKAGEPLPSPRLEASWDMRPNAPEIIINHYLAGTKLMKVAARAHADKRSGVPLRAVRPAGARPLRRARVGACGGRTPPHPARGGPSGGAPAGKGRTTKSTRQASGHTAAAA